jgi:transposase
MSCLPRWAEHWDVHLFLPPYSPELNLIEILWRKMKYEWLEWHAYLDFENNKVSIMCVRTSEVNSTLNLSEYLYLKNHLI